MNLLFKKDPNDYKQAAKQAAPKQIDLSAYPKENTVSTCCSFFFFLLFVPCSIVFFYHAAPTTIVSLVIIWVLITLAPWASHAGGSVLSDVSGPMLTVMCFTSVILAGLNGVRCYYMHSQPLRQLALSREYKGVYPELPAVGFPDAAYVEFAGNATIDSSKGVSFQSLDSGLSNFCVAPIVTKASTGVYNFWAIGVDCCGEKGDKFECYDAGVPGVKTGWVLPTQHGDKLFSSLGIYVAPSEQRRDLFTKAVLKAEAVHGIAHPGEHTIFVRWTKATKPQIVAWEATGVAITVVFSIVWQTIVSFIMTRLYQRFTYASKMHHKIHNNSRMDTEEEDSETRLQQFLSDALENVGDADMGDAIRGVKRAGKENLQRFRPPLSATDMCLMGVVVPYLILMLCVITSTFTPCERFGHLIQAPFWCMTFVFILALLATPNRAISGLFILLCCIAGYYIGNVNYKDNMFHFCSTSDRRMYTDVHADANTEDFWDAGRLTFEDSVQLSTKHSVGFLYEGTAYCAAPVISKTAPCMDMPNTSFTADATTVDDTSATVATTALQANHPLLELNFPTFMQRRSARHQSHRQHSRQLVKRVGMDMGCTKPRPEQVEFWAIGVNCCDARKKFWCDGGELSDAHEAVVVRSFGDEDGGYHESEGPKLKSNRQHFFQAIDQAVATYDLPSPQRPMLIRWGSSSKELQNDWRKRATGVILMTGLGSLLVILAIGIASHCWMKQARYLEKKSMEDYSRRSGGGAGPSVYGDGGGDSSPRPSLLPAADLPRGQIAPEERRRLEDELRF